MNDGTMYAMVVDWICRRAILYLGSFMLIDIRDFYDCHRDLHKKYKCADLRDAWNRAIERIHVEFNIGGVAHEYMPPGKGRGRGGPRLYAALVVPLDPPQLYFPKLSEYCKAALNLPRRHVFEPRVPAPG